MSTANMAYYCKDKGIFKCIYIVTVLSEDNLILEYRVSKYDIWKSTLVLVMKCHCHDSK